jgi:hypothetical protein
VYPVGPPREKPSVHKGRKRKKERILIEGKFGQGKRVYGLNNIQAKRQDTSQCWISAIFFVMNLVTLGKIAGNYAIFKKQCQTQIHWTFSLFFAMKRMRTNTIFLPQTGQHQKIGRVTF